MERGAWCLRMGDPSMRPMPRAPRVIDYAHSAIRSDWMDVFLCARCRFFIGNTSGNYYTHNSWDLLQEGFFGAATSANVGFGSPVASTSSFDRYEGSAGTTAGPWTRVVYPGSYGWPVGAVGRVARAGGVADGRGSPGVAGCHSTGGRPQAVTRRPKARTTGVRMREV